MPFQKKDFIEIEFTGKVKDTRQVFDSTIYDELKKLNPNAKKEDAKPFVFCLGEDMFLKGAEEFLIGKETGKYEIELSPENAFGNREAKLIQIIPIKVFYQQQIAPQPGMVFNFDGRLGKVLSVSGGRVITDFNNPLAGKAVIYDVNVIKKVDDLNEKIKSLIDFFARKEIPFAVEGKKLILNISGEKENQKNLGDFLMMFADKFKEILDLEMEIKKSEEKKTEEVKK